jgi:hypothetical protein
VSDLNPPGDRPDHFVSEATGTPNFVVVDNHSQSPYADIDGCIWWDLKWPFIPDWVPDQTRKRYWRDPGGLMEYRVIVRTQDERYLLLGEYVGRYSRYPEDPHWWEATPDHALRLLLESDHKHTLPDDLRRRLAPPPLPQIAVPVNPVSAPSETPKGEDRQPPAPTVRLPIDLPGIEGFRPFHVYVGPRGAQAGHYCLSPPVTSNTPDGTARAGTASIEEKNCRVKDYLKKHPGATSEVVGFALELPPQTVRRLPAWKERSQANQPKSCRPGSKERLLTPGILASRAGDDPDPSDVAAQHDELAVWRARYLDVLTPHQKAEFFSLSEQDQLDRIGEFIANENDGLSPLGN